MSLGFFTNLEPEITRDILSRLPARTITHCKCVCKPWLGLLETDEFAKHHLSKSAPGLAVRLDLYLPSRGSTIILEVYEFEDVLDLDPYPVTSFDLSIPLSIQGSASGLLLLRDHNRGPGTVYVCNPTTRDCIKIDCPPDFVYTYPQKVSFGFGTSRRSFQHKVVRVFHDCLIDDRQELLAVDKYKCHVYTLGTGLWRRVTPGAPLVYNCNAIGAFMNGNLHWFVTDLDGSPWISCFDLETEVFHAFSAPPADGRMLVDVFALGDCLSVCDNSSYSEIAIWTMEEYGVEKSWSKKYVISKMPDFCGECYENVRPFKVFQDGDILMTWLDFFLFYYSNMTKTLKVIDIFGQYNKGAVEFIPHTSSFLSLKGFTLEKLISL